MIRNRTNLYIAYRRTFPHHPKDALSRQGSPFERAGEEEQGLIHREQYRDEQGIELTQLPPSMVQLEQESQAMLDGLVGDITELGKLYRKNMLPGFNDTSEDEAKIEQLSAKITRKFQFMYAQIRRLDDDRLQFQRRAETQLVDNLKKKLALRTQELSTSFRRLQNNYIRYLREDEYDVNVASSSADETRVEDEGSAIESYSRQVMQAQQQEQGVSDEYLQQREREIYKIAQGVVEISTIFKELETMVLDQGTVLDRIDYNLAQTVDNVKKADRQMTKAQGYQKATLKCKVVMFLVLLIIFILFLLLIKPKGHPASQPSAPSAPTAPSVDHPNIEKPGDINDGSGRI